jgi:hypothetical protein
VNDKEIVMKRQKRTPQRPDPKAKNEPAKRMKTGEVDDVREAPEEGTGRDPACARGAEARQDDTDHPGHANEEA